MTTLHPLGPFPPVETRDGVDLAAILAEDVFTRDAIAGPVRSGLASALDRTVKAGDLSGAASVVVALVDSWPIAALVDEARGQADTSQGLAILARAAELARMGLGWPTLAHTVWPCPPAEWIEHHAADARGLVSVSPDDGSAEIAAALGLDPVPTTPVEGVEVVTGESLLDRRHELAGRLARGERRAVHIDGGIVPGPATGFALGELEMEGPHQRPWARYGSAGLRVTELGAWRDALVEPTPGAVEGPLQARCLGAVLPGPPAALERGEVQRAGWLLWDGPHAPKAVTPRAAGLVVLVSRGADRDRIASALEVDLAEVDAGIVALRELGALSGSWD